MLRKAVIVGVVLLAIVGSAAAISLARPNYQVSVMLPSATNLVSGGAVKVRGFDAGTITDLTPTDGQAKVTIELDSDYAPLHDGATVNVQWKALVGERHLTITDGPERNADVPSGGMLKGRMPQPMELDQVLAALDKPTRDRLASLINNLNGTLGGHEQDFNRTVRTAGPALQSLGEVLKGLGTDGPAITQLIDQVERMVSTLAHRDGDVRNVVDQLSRTSAATVTQRRELSDALHRLPGTLRTAESTLGQVPDTTKEAVPLLQDLQPATRRLPAVARKLNPVLTDLRPTIAQLKPTLASAQGLLAHTPGLLDRAHAVLPGATSLVSDINPALDFLRPYSPEVAGFVSNWSSAMANYGGNGHYVRVLPQVGLSSVNINPGALPPGFGVDQTPAPGSLAGQPWTDATGGGVR